MQEPPYSMASVKPPERDLSGTVVTKLTGRAAWLAQLPEMLLLCNEASKRYVHRHLVATLCAFFFFVELALCLLLVAHFPFAPRFLVSIDLFAHTPNVLLSLRRKRARRQFRSKHAANGNKPLSLEYMADRLDTDDPVWGMTVRDGASGEMHAYVTVTTFTTWVRWFRWDSLAELAGLIRERGFV